MTEVLIVCIAVVGGVALCLLLTAILYRCKVSEVRKQEEEEEYKQDAWFASMSTPAAYRYMNDPRSKEKIRIPAEASTSIHLIILVHGWNGRPCSLGYMKDALERQAAAASTTTATLTGEDTTPFFIIHAATANQGKTSDGVAVGGSRLALEVEEIIQNITDQIQQQQQQGYEDIDIKAGKKEVMILSLSFVGHSLGGIYAHYAVSEISSIQKQHDSSTMLIVRPAIFCTACSPHLGLLDNLSYIPLPRCLQYVVASVLMQKTGQDLFRFTSLLEVMVMEPVFRNALALFQRRITYVNTYATDFQVPTQTAAFLARSDTIHRLVVENPVASDDANSTTTSDAAGMIELVVETTKIHQQQQQEQCTDTNQQSHDSPSTLLKTTATSFKTTAALAQEMDALGWIKVFCDTRRTLKSFPRCCFKCKNESICATSTSLSCRRSMSKCEDNLELHGNINKADNNLEDGTNDWNENKTFYTSSELLNKYNLCSKDRYYFPAGHFVLVAETKTVGEIKLTAKGHPIVDDLARRLVEGILAQQ